MTDTPMDTGLYMSISTPIEVSLSIPQHARGLVPTMHFLALSNVSLPISTEHNHAVGRSRCTSVVPLHEDGSPPRKPASPPLALLSPPPSPPPPSSLAVWAGQTEPGFRVDVVSKDSGTETSATVIVEAMSCPTATSLHFWKSSIVLLMRAFAAASALHSICSKFSPGPISMSSI